MRLVRLSIIVGIIKNTINKEIRMKNLDKLSHTYGTDKNITGHWYTKLYEEYFTPLRESAKNVLEIGVYNGESIRLWKDYFRNAEIYGIDIDPEDAQYIGLRQHIFIGDQSDVEFLNTVVDSIDGPLDIIVDDGSHRMAHYIVTFNTLFLTLRSQGWYVIEDVNYDGPAETFYEFMQYLIQGVMLDRGMNLGQRDRALEQQTNLDKLTPVQLAIQEVHIYDNIIFIRRA